MPVAIAGRAPATFEIKSANLPLVALLLKSADLQSLAEELQARFGELPEFFDNDPLVIDLGPLQGQQASIDFTALLELLRRYKVLPVAVKGGSQEQMASAVHAGLAAAPEAREQAGDGLRVQPAMAAAAAPASALVIDKPLRSGQQVYARGRDLVVLSMVNPGAEVMADGHIHVYAPLRGRAIAGAQGNTEARIFAASMEPQLLSIAGIYRTTETELPPEVRGKPAQVRLEGERLVVEPLKH